MAIFDPVKLNWNGTDYMVPADRVMGAIARIEDVLTIDELAKYLSKKTVPLAKIAQGYGALLRYAGAIVTDEEVYDGMFGGTAERDVIVSAMTTLMAMMLPKSVTAGGKPNPTKRPRRGASG